MALDPSDSPPHDFSENSDFWESSVRYNARQPDAVTIRMKERGTYFGVNFPHMRTEIVPPSEMEQDGSSPFSSPSTAESSIDVGGETTTTSTATSTTRTGWRIGCWPTFRSWAATATRSWWDAAQSSVKLALDRIQTWPTEEEDTKGPHWVVRIISEYENQRGEIIDDVTEWEFRSAENAEKFVIEWNKQVQKKCPNYPFNVYIFKKDEGEQTAIEEEINSGMNKDLPQGSVVHTTTQSHSIEHLLNPGGFKFEDLF